MALTLVVVWPCRHAAAADDVEELAVQQVQQEVVLEARFRRLNTTLGVDDPRTLQSFFELYDLWIQLYRLNKADEVLRELLPACERRRDDFGIRAIQALAFLRWKQSRFREALARFHEMEGLMGKNAALCENIGHTYNSLGEFVEAERYFEDSLKFIRTLPPGADHNEGGILLGLAGIKDRLGAHAEALPKAMQSYEFYKARDGRRGWDSSLSSKAGMQVSKSHMKLGNLGKAEQFTREAIQIFEKTAGEESPLCASAYERLGTVLWMQGKRTEAQEALHRAYQIEAIKDAMDLVEILEIHNRLMETHLHEATSLDRAAFRKYFPVVDQVVQRVQTEMVQDGNAGAYYKTAGELRVLGNDCDKGTTLLLEAVRLFANETSIDTSGLVKQCLDLLGFCDGSLLKKTKDAEL